MDEQHGHLVDLARHAILCVCRPCYLLFTHDGAGGKRFRAIPQRYQPVQEFATAQDAWELLQIPIGLAFFFRSSITGRTTAFYPSPAGATESLLPAEAWTDLLNVNPSFGDLEPDVEALLVARGERGFECFLVPIDACYELVGRVRRSWKGFDGGQEARVDIAAFFTTLRARSKQVAWAS